MWERFRGVGKHYDPDLDYKQKIEEMRSEWEADQAAKVEEKGEKGAVGGGAEELEDDSVWTDDVSTYYKRTAPSSFNEKVGKTPSEEDAE